MDKTAVFRHDKAEPEAAHHRFMDDLSNRKENRTVSKVSADFLKPLMRVAPAGFRWSVATSR
jgi:hypothetical protein